MAPGFVTTCNMNGFLFSFFFSGMFWHMIFSVNEMNLLGFG